MLENSWNTAVRIVFDLPLQTHCNLIEPISKTKHLKFVLIERFLSFLYQIEKSRKLIPKQLLSFIKKDVRSTTGSNLRNILLATNKNNIDEICIDDIRKMVYEELDVRDKWKINFIDKITNVKFNQLDVEQFTREELDEILNFLCTS